MTLGDCYAKVVKVISISILYHTMRLDEKENTDFIYYGTTELVGLHTNKALVLHEAMANGERVPVVTSKDVFPEYYMIYVEKFQDAVDGAIDEWVYFFKHGEIRDDFKSSGIRLAAKKLDYLAMNEKQRRRYDGYLAAVGRELGVLETSRFEGKEVGLVEGEVIGLAKGEAIGLAKGESAGRIAMARKMLLVSEPLEKIIEFTELSLEVVQELARELGLCDPL